MKSNLTIDVDAIYTRLVESDTRVTIAAFLVELWYTYPGASNEDVVAAVKSRFSGTYALPRVAIDRRKFNKGEFTCQGGIAPKVKAFDPNRSNEGRTALSPSVKAQIAAMDEATTDAETASDQD